MRFIRIAGVRGVIRNAIFALTVLVGVSMFAQASALEPEQDTVAEEGDEDRSTAFRSVSGPELNRVPGGQLLVYAYGLAWLLVSAFMWRRIGKLQVEASRDLARLSRLVEAKTGK